VVEEKDRSPTLSHRPDQLVHKGGNAVIAVFHRVQAHELAHRINNDKGGAVTLTRFGGHPILA
jgi:hypothetical protein